MHVRYELVSWWRAQGLQNVQRAGLENPDFQEEWTLEVRWSALASTASRRTGDDWEEAYVSLLLI